MTSRGLLPRAVLRPSQYFISSRQIASASFVPGMSNDNVVERRIGAPEARKTDLDHHFVLCRGKGLLSSSGGEVGAR